MLDLECRGCGAALRVEANLRTATCPYCGSPSVVERPPMPGRPEPAFALGFSLTQDAARAHVGRWLKRRSFFSPSAVRHASLEDVRGVYLPAWLYSAVARTRYSAEVGENYTVTYTTTVNGKSETRTRTETEWRTLSGEHAEYVADVLVTASRGLDNDELNRIESFDLRLLHRYEPAIISGWIAEDPTLSHDASMEHARNEALELVGKRLTGFMPGDKHRNLQWSAQFHDEGAELVLVPIWVLAARWSPTKPPLRILVNGQSGEVTGKVPLSAWKIVLTVLAGLAVVAGAALALAQAAP